MSHELDFTLNKPAIAFRGPVPWHGFGESIQPGDTLEDIQFKGGIEYTVEKTPVMYQRKVAAPLDGGAPFEMTETDDTSCVLYRSDTGGALGVVGNRYQVVQPKQVIEFYRDLTEQFGFELEVVGALKGGRKVWATANTKNAIQLRGRDEVKGYLLLATSYDGTMSTQIRNTSVRTVCNNTLQLAISEGIAAVTVPHSTKFNADAVKQQLKIGQAWETFAEAADTMSRRIVGKDESMRFLLDVYYGLTSTDEIKAFQDDEKNTKSAEKLMARLTTALFNSPGANLESAKGMLWGLVNAVTYDVDFQLPSRSNDTRFDKGQFGVGNAIKQRAWTRALTMAA